MKSVAGSSVMALCMMGASIGVANAQTPAGTVPVQAGNPPATAAQVIPSVAGPNPIPVETRTGTANKSAGPTGLAPVREVPPPIVPSNEASNFVPSSGTVSSNPNGLPITPNPAISSVTPYLFHGYGFPSVGYSMPYGYRSSIYGGMAPPTDFARMRRMTRLMNDLDQLVPGVAPPQSRISELEADLNAMLYAEEKPPAQVVRKLAYDLARVLPSRGVPMLNTGSLARDLEIVINVGKASPAQIQDAVSNVRRNLSYSAVSPTGAQLIVSDLRMLISGDVPVAAGDAKKPLTFIP